jgi:hypothetical protein
MERNTNVYSHIQLVVPEWYKLGGAPVDDTVYNWCDGDVDSIETFTPDTKTIGWEYPDEEALCAYTLVYGHQGDDGVIEVHHDGAAVDLGGSDGLGFAQTGADNWFIDTNEFYRQATSTEFSSVLIETKDPVAATTHAIDITTAGDQARLIMFSRDYRVPLYNKNWSCRRSFKIHESESYLKQKSPRFHLRNEYREVAEHSFEWSGLSVTDKRMFDIFFAAFGGNTNRPFAMCIIHGIPNPPQFLMTCRILLIDSGSVDIGWRRNKEMQTDGLSFTAIELIPN